MSALSVNKVGRPSDYTQELADSIAERLVTRSLREICQQDEDVPDRKTIIRWKAANPDFAAKCARASKEHADYVVEKARQDAESCTEENAKSTKVKLDFAQWYAARLNQGKWGDRPDTKVLVMNLTVPAGMEKEFAKTIDAQLVKD